MLSLDQFTVCQATKPATDWGAFGNPEAVQTAKGLAAKIMAQAVAHLNPAADLSYSASLPFLCAFFCNARAQKCLDSCSTVKTVKEMQKMGASRGDNPVARGLANCERPVFRVARLGGLPSGTSRFISPQRRCSTTSFSTSPSGSTRAIGTGKRAGRRPPPGAEIPTSDVGDLSFVCLTASETASLSPDLGCSLSARRHLGTSVVQNSRGPFHSLGTKVC